MKTIVITKKKSVQNQKDSVFNHYNFCQIYQRVEKLNPNAIQQWGIMNVTQMPNHLKIATASGLGIYKLEDESTWLWRNIIKFFALRVLRRLPKNTKAAEGFKSEMNMPLEFNLEREQLLLILQKAHTSDNENYPHPMFGIMSKKEWGRLIFRHFDHHLRQFSN